MANHPHQATVGNVFTTSRSFAQFRAAVTGSLHYARFDSDTAAYVGTPGSSEIRFDIHVNGVTIFADPNDRPEMVNGDYFVEIDLEALALDVAVDKGDLIELMLVMNGSFPSIGSKLYAQIEIEDGFPSYFGGTSATSFAIGTGSKAFTTQAGLAYIVGNRVLITSSAAPTTNFMSGIITGYSGTTLTVLVDVIGGSGTHTDWLFGLAGKDGTNGTNGTNGAGYGGTSTTSLAIGTGSKAFTTQAGLAYVVGSRVRASSAAAPTINYMEGVVTAYSSTTLTVTIDRIAGSGTYTDWNLSIAGDVGPVEFGVAVSDETTALTTGTAKLTFYIQQAFTLVAIWAGLSAQSTSGAVTIDVKKNGTTIFSTKITIDANEDTSLTAATAYALTGTTTFARGDKVTVNIDGAGTAAAGLKLFFEGVR